MEPEMSSTRKKIERPGARTGAEQPCDTCGKMFYVARCLQGKTRFCSRECMRIAAPTRRHGMSYTPENEAWGSMRKRCLNPNHKAYKDYGGRGITIDPRWDSFENFLADMGMRPGPEYSLERLDNEKGYGPDNCKWATNLEQSRNRRGNWTDEEIALLKKGHAEGLIFSEIARRYLPHKCASAVASKGKRLGLASHFDYHAPRKERQPDARASEHISDDCEAK